MKNLMLLLPLLAVMFAGCAKQNFEGVISYQMTAGTRTNPSEYAIKGDRVRMTLGAEKSQTIGLFNAATGEMRILMPAQRSYLILSGPKETAAKVPAAASDAKLEATGRSDSIAGYRCTQYLITDKNHTQEVWVTSRLGRFVAFSEAQNNRSGISAWAQLLADRGWFPLRMITKDRTGKVVATLEATKVERKSLDPALFEIPEGYKQFSLPGLGGLLKGAGPRPD